MADISARITELKNIIIAALNAATNDHELEQVRLAHLTRQPARRSSVVAKPGGELAQLMASLGGMSVEEKREFGPLFNQIRAQVYARYEERKQELSHAQHAAAHKKQEQFDVTAYQPHQLRGSLHPYTPIVQKIEDVFISMGYMVADGPELETEWYNFDALNIPADHPARDMQDTLWLSLPGMLMRTHTSNVQIRVMQQHQPPLAMLSMGRVWRYEATDVTHDYLFWQAEGLLVSKHISMANLLATMKTLLQALFEREDIDMSIRPTYYPFVEPGIEVHMKCVFCTNGCSICKHTGYIEVVGAGLVHPHVLKACNIDPAVYTGCAFGFGLTRLVMLRYGINDIRQLSNGNLEFLKQF